MRRVDGGELMPDRRAGSARNSREASWAGSVEDKESLASWTGPERSRTPAACASRGRYLLNARFLPEPSLISVAHSFSICALTESGIGT
jgi:hypothetical protein